MTKSNRCKLCDHAQVKLMECDFLAGFADADIAKKYGVCDRTWRSHRTHSTVINQLRGEMKEVAEMTELPSLNLTSDELKMLSIWHLCQSVKRLDEIARSSGSVRAEQALADNIMKLNQLMKGVEFEHSKPSSRVEPIETW